jgi:hypothetical protein
MPEDYHPAKKQSIGNINNINKLSSDVITADDNKERGRPLLGSLLLLELVDVVNV